MFLEEHLSLQKERFLIKAAEIFRLIIISWTNWHWVYVDVISPKSYKMFSPNGFTNHKIFTICRELAMD